MVNKGELSNAFSQYFDILENVGQYPQADTARLILLSFLEEMRADGFYQTLSAEDKETINNIIECIKKKLCILPYSSACMKKKGEKVYIGEYEDCTFYNKTVPEYIDYNPQWQDISETCDLIYVRPVDVGEEDPATFPLSNGYKTVVSIDLNHSSVTYGQQKIRTVLDTYHCPIQHLGRIVSGSHVYDGSDYVVVNLNEDEDTVHLPFSLWRNDIYVEAPIEIDYESEVTWSSGLVTPVTLNSVTSELEIEVPENNTGVARYVNFVVKEDITDIDIQESHTNSITYRINQTSSYEFEFTDYPSYSTLSLDDLDADGETVFVGITSTGGNAFLNYTITNVPTGVTVVQDEDGIEVTVGFNSTTSERHYGTFILTQDNTGETLSISVNQAGQESSADWQEQSRTCKLVTYTHSANPSQTYKTGVATVVYEDVNPHSPTYEETRTEDVSDTTTCPIDNVGYLRYSDNTSSRNIVHNYAAETIDYPLVLYKNDVSQTPQGNVTVTANSGNPSWITASVVGSNLRVVIGLNATGYAKDGNFTVTETLSNIGTYSSVTYHVRQTAMIVFKFTENSNTTLSKPCPATAYTFSNIGITSTTGGVAQSYAVQSASSDLTVTVVSGGIRVEVAPNLTSSQRTLSAVIRQDNSSATITLYVVQEASADNYVFTWPSGLPNPAPLTVSHTHGTYVMPVTSTRNGVNVAYTIDSVSSSISAWTISRNSNDNSLEIQTTTGGKFNIITGDIVLKQNISENTLTLNVTQQPEEPVITPMLSIDSGSSTTGTPSTRRNITLTLSPAEAVNAALSDIIYGDLTIEFKGDTESDAHWEVAGPMSYTGNNQCLVIVDIGTHQWSDYFNVRLYKTSSTDTYDASSLTVTISISH